MYMFFISIITVLFFMSLFHPFQSALSTMEVPQEHRQLNQRSPNSTSDSSPIPSFLNTSEQSLRIDEMLDKILTFTNETKKLQTELDALERLYREKLYLKGLINDEIFERGNRLAKLKIVYALVMIGVAPETAGAEHEIPPLITALTKLGPAPVVAFASNVTRKILENSVGVAQNLMQFFSSLPPPELSASDQKAFNCTKECLLGLSSLDPKLSSGAVWSNYEQCLRSQCEITQGSSNFPKFLLALAKKVNSLLIGIYGSAEKTPRRLRNCPIVAGNDTFPGDLWGKLIDWERVMLHAETLREACEATKKMFIGETVTDASTGCKTEAERELQNILNTHSTALFLALNTGGELIARCPNIYEVEP